MLRWDIWNNLNVLIQSPKGCWRIEWVILMRETSLFFFFFFKFRDCQWDGKLAKPASGLSALRCGSVAWAGSSNSPDSSQRKAMGSNKLFSLHFAGNPSHWMPRAVRFRLEMCCPRELLTNPATLLGGPNFLEAQWWFPVSVLGERRSPKNPLF